MFNNKAIAYFVHQKLTLKAIIVIFNLVSYLYFERLNFKIKILVIILILIYINAGKLEINTGIRAKYLD